MTTNEWLDNMTLWAASLNGLANGTNGDAIVSGCGLTAGAGDWETDVDSGTVINANTTGSVSADTVLHTDPASDADMDTGESRIDLVVSNASDNTSIIEGTAATNPVSPDISTDDVLLGFWLIAESDSTLADSTLFDMPPLAAPDSAKYQSTGPDTLDAGDIGGGSGNDGEILTSDGVDASWQDSVTDSTVPTDETTSRRIDTWYQNTLPNAIVVYATPNGTYTVDVNSSQSANVILDNSTGETDKATFVVGIDDYYRINGVGASSVNDWAEGDLL